MLGSRRSDCPISISLELFGDRWTLLILRDMVFFEKKHFRDFAVQERIASNILTDRLKKLIAQDIIVKKRDPQNLSAFDYSLTKRGITLIPILVEMMIWGQEYTESIVSNSALMTSLKIDKDGTVNELIASVTLVHSVQNS